MRTVSMIKEDKILDFNMEIIPAICNISKAGIANSSPGSVLRRHSWASMLSQICAILCGTAAITGAQTVRLLLPGFQGRELEARILSYVRGPVSTH